MAASAQMRAAIKALSQSVPEGCLIDHKEDKPIYTLVKVHGWPYDVHYEFRFSRQHGLFVECHIENKQYANLGAIFEKIADEVPEINGRRLEYYTHRDAPHRKQWPSLSIPLGPNATGEEAAETMRQLIDASRQRIHEALGQW